VSIINHPNTRPKLDTLEDTVPHMHDSSGILGNIRAFILLAGVIRSTAFTEGIQRSVLNLPLDSTMDIFQHWYQHVQRMIANDNYPAMPLRVLVDNQSILPVAPPIIDGSPLVIERDPLEFRGTGGVLADATAEYDANDYVIVGHAASIFLEDVGCLVLRLSDLKAEIAILADPNGTPAGLMLIRCHTLRQIPLIGFVDLNEQAMPLIAAKHDVRVLCQPVERYGIRNCSEYVNAVRQFHNMTHGKQSGSDPWIEPWLSTFGFCEEDSSVAKDSHLVDSIVLRGAEVKSGAVLVRSVACPGVMIESHATVVDKLAVPDRPSVKDRRK
jgi:hypothetical protein